ncbi:HNH endonuclease [Erwinia psidii]|nr:HNH endonuclease [Erwinia psidii]
MVIHMPKNGVTSKKEIEKDLTIKLISMSSPSIEYYRSTCFLSENIEELEDLKKTFRPYGFSSSMRAYQLKKLPDMTVKAEVSMVICPYCLNHVTLESCRADHVIPYKVYLRYQAYRQAMNNVEKNVNDSSMTDIIKNNLVSHSVNLTAISESKKNKKTPFSEIEKKSYNDFANLLLCCQQCNSTKSNTMNITGALQVSMNYANHLRQKSLYFKIRNILSMLEEIFSCNTKIKSYILTDRQLEGVSVNFIDYIKKTDPEKRKPFKPRYNLNPTLDGFDINSLILEHFPEKEEVVTKRARDEDLIQNTAYDTEYKKIKSDIAPEENAKPENVVTDKPQNNKSINSLLLHQELLGFEKYIINNNRINFSDAPLLKYYYHFRQLESEFYSREKTDLVSYKKPTGIDTGADNSDEDPIKMLLLECQMTVRSTQIFKGKPCIYCYGVYEASSFDIDHIKPSKKIHKGQFIDKERIKRNNDLKNLIAVCKTCNTTKGNLNLTENDTLYLQRQKKVMNSNYTFRMTHVENPDTGKTYTLEELNEIRNIILKPPF